MPKVDFHRISPQHEEDVIRRTGAYRHESGLDFLNNRLISAENFS